MSYLIEAPPLEARLYFLHQFLYNLSLIIGKKSNEKENSSANHQISHQTYETDRRSPRTQRRHKT